MLKIFFAAALIAASAMQTSQMTGGCAPAARRVPAVRHARLINTAEAMAFKKSRQYVALSELGIGDAPDDYTVQLSTDGRSYSFSIKDRLDSCHGAIFSDQEGLIYTATAIQ